MQLGLAAVLLGLAAGPPPSELGSGDAQVVWLSGAGWAADVLPEPSPAMPIERGGVEARAGLGVEARAWPGDGEPADGRAVEAGSGDARVWNASLPLPSLSPMPQEPSLEPDGEGGSGDASVWNPLPQEAEPAPAPKQPVLQEPEPDAGGAESDVPGAWGSEGPAKPRCSATLGLLLCWMSGCVRECSSEISGALLMLVIAGMAAHTFGNLMSGAGFPAVTTFLAFGVVLGPYGTNIIRVEDAKKLLWFNDVALGFIGLSAGGKLHMNEVRENLRAALSVLFCLVTVTYLGSICSTLSFGERFLPFMSEMEWREKLCAALLIACLAVARSPSSAIAIIEELHAKGPFTTTCLTVTVLTDVIVVLLFALTNLVISALMPGADGASAGGAELLLQFVKQTLLSVLIGVLLGRAMPLVYSCGSLDGDRACLGRSSAMALLLPLVCGAASVGLMLLQRLVFLFAGWALFFDEEYEEEAHNWSMQNPLICCMVAGFVACNFTRASHDFHHSVTDLSGPIYLLFFTFTGITMDLGVLWRNRSAAILLFGSRTACIFIGSRLGGELGGQPPEFAKRYWMAFLTQAH